MEATHETRASRDVLIGFRRTPLLSVLSITTIAFSLFAFGLFALVALNIRKTLEQARGARGDPRVPRRRDAGRSRVGGGRHGAFPEVQPVENVTPETALAARAGGAGRVPRRVRGRVPARVDRRAAAQGHRDPATVKTVAARIKSFSFVDDVRYGEDWIEKLYRLRNIADVAGLCSASRSRSSR